MSGSSFTVEFWVKADPSLSYSTEQLLVECGNGWATGTYQITSFNDNNITVNFNGSTSGGVSTTVDWTDGEWHHLAGVFSNPLNAIALIYDGELVNYVIENAAPGSANVPVYLGSRQGSSMFSQVTLDEVRIWNLVKDTTMVKETMHRELTGAESGLVAYFPMNEGSGATLSDQTANTNDGSISGASWIGSSCFAGPGKGLDFDGSDDYLECGTDASVDITGSEITVEAWIRPGSFGGFPWDNSIVCKHGTAAVGYVLRCGGSGYLSFNLGNGATWYEVLSPSGSLQIDTWHHVAGVYDGTTQWLYIDGILVDSVSRSFTVASNAARRLQIGSSDAYPTRFFDGTIDEVQVWSAARTAWEIREAMYRTLDGDEAGLEAYYRFDQGGGTVTCDASDNSNTGTLHNMNDADWVGAGSFNTWLGGSSGSWSEGANYSLGSSGGNVGVFAWSMGSAPVISGTPSITNLVIGAGATVAATSDFDVSGNLLVAGTLEVQTTASGAETTGTGIIAPTGLIQVDQGTELTITGELEIQGTLRNLGTLYGNGDIVNDGTFANGSDATGDGQMILESTLSGTGSFVSERYYAAQSNDGSKPTGRWLYISPSVNGADSDNILSGTVYSRIYKYSESGYAWQQITAPETLVTGKGYATRIGTDQTIAYSGTTFHQGTQTTPVTVDVDGWNLVGNPYPVAIDIDTVMGWNSGLVGPTAWVRTNGSFATWNSLSDIATNSATQRVAPMQAFWVRAHTAGDFEFRNSDRDLQPVSFLKTAPAVTRPMLRLKVSNNDAGDEAVLAFIGGSQDGFDVYDTPKKLGSASAEIWFQLPDGTSLTADVRPEVPDSCEFPLGIRTLEEGSYTISVTQLDGFDEGKAIVLDDLVEGITHPVSDTLVVHFGMGVESTFERFRIRFVPTGVNESEEATGWTGVSGSSPVRIHAAGSRVFLNTGDLGTREINVRVYDLNGRILLASRMQGEKTYALDMPGRTGIHIVLLQSAEAMHTEKIYLNGTQTP
ncbi:MAG: LamG-like jellyroll fold domain-containing protein [Bacteroidales bacterium]